jgi:carbon storage regulator
MLVLARSRNEALRIGEEIEIEVLEIKGSAVRLGISAPENVRVMRTELTIPLPESGTDRIRRQKSSKIASR